MYNKNKLIIALTGGIASGKSTALKIAEGFGVKTADSDCISRKLFKQAAIKSKIKKHFGQCVFVKGKIDRKKLAEIVFENSSKLKTLEKILHPKIISALKLKVANFKKRGNGVFVADVPLLFEKKLEKGYDLVMVIASSKKNQCLRLKERGLSKREIQLRLKAQMPVKMKVKKADIIVTNNGSLKNYKITTKNIFKSLTKSYKKV